MSLCDGDLGRRPAARAPCRPACRREASRRRRPASPKSVMRTRPVPSSMTFAGFRSRWMHAALVRGGQAGADLARHLERALHREPPDPPQQRRQVLAVHVLHRQEGVAVDFVDVVDAADVRMRDLPRHPHFVVELHQPRRIAIELRRQELQRDRLRQLQVVGAIDLAHAAAPEPSDDPVAAAEQRARGKTPVIDRVGRRQPSATTTRRGSRLAARGTEDGEPGFALGASGSRRRAASRRVSSSSGSRCRRILPPGGCSRSLPDGHLADPVCCSLCGCSRPNSCCR